MAFYDIFNQIFDPILGPLMSMGAFWALLVISLIISILTTLVYKWMTNQAMMKQLKDEIKMHQNEMKKHKSDPSKMMEVQKKAMDKNMKYMMHSFKPTLITFIPLIIIFGWLSSNLAYEPIMPGANFETYVFLQNDSSDGAKIIVPEGIRIISNETSSVKKISAGEELKFKNKNIAKKRYGGFLEEGKDIYYAGWILNGDAGEYDIQYVAGNQSSPVNKEILISDRKYKSPMEVVNLGNIKGILVDQKNLVVMDIFGWKLGWLGAYIIFSLVFSMSIRKLLKVY